MIIRQGDVLLVKTDAVKGEEISNDPRGLVLAEGESSGHYHAVFGAGSKLFKFRDTNQRMLVVGDEGADLRVVGGGSGGVDRHTPISLKPGNYEIRIQRSWTSANASRQVQD